jgi:hypothetical protein
VTQPALHLLGLAELTAQAAETISDARKAVDGDHYARAIEVAAASACHPNYSGCVPAYPPDVNCPEVAGPVQVTGSDPHGLDRDNDGGRANDRRSCTRGLGV